MTRSPQKTVRDYSKSLLNSVRSGRALSKSMENNPIRSPGFVVALTEVGENTGNLANQYQILARHYEAGQCFA